VQAAPALHGVLAGAAGVDRLVALDDETPDPPHEVDIELLETPHALRLTVERIPRAAPYLAVDPALIAAAGARLRALRGRRIGLAWAAGAWRPERSVPLALLAPLFERPGIAPVNLQRGPALDELRALGRPVFAQDPTRWSDDLAETAATILNLDLVVTVDTMVAHLAGALGAPVFTLLHRDADWRWMRRGSDTPWYPTMRLFRQRRAGDWRAPVDALLRAVGRPRSPRASATPASTASAPPACGRASVSPSRSTDTAIAKTGTR
jgi:hypothetical protein